MKKKFIIILFIAFIYNLNLFAQSVTGIHAFFNHGQTFLTWNKIPKLKNVVYYVYRSKEPFLNFIDFNRVHFIAKVSDSSALNSRLSSILHRTIYFRIGDMRSELNNTKCLYVQTTFENAKVYYAVQAYINEDPFIAIKPGNNVLKEPVNEKIESVMPVYQMKFDSLGQTHNIFVHWVSKYGNQFYPAMTSTYCYYYNFELIRKGDIKRHPLYIHLHARAMNFLSYDKGTNNPDEWVLSLDDYMPNYIKNSFWYGYSEHFNFFNPDSTPKTGKIIDYTIRRAKWTLEWVEKNFPIDTNRVYIGGESMGASGAILIGMAIPDKIAAIFAIMPKFNYAFTQDPDSKSIYNSGMGRREMISKLWGKLSANLPTFDGTPVYNRLNASYMAKLLRDKALPVIIAFNGKNDRIVGWGEKPDFYRNYEQSLHGGYFFWDGGAHLFNTSKEWSPEKNSSILYHYVLNQSYPAFSHCSADNYPGNDKETDGDKFGAINGFLSWKGPIIDRTDFYEIHIEPNDLKSTEGIRHAPEQIYVDITLRRLQNLRIDQLHHYYFQDINERGKIIHDGYIVPDKQNLLTIDRFQVTKGGNRLIVIPVLKEKSNK